VQIYEVAGRLDLSALQARLAPLGEVRANEFALRFRIDGYEMTVFADGRAIIKGTSDPGTARSLYTRYVGGEESGRDGGERNALASIVREFGNCCRHRRTVSVHTILSVALSLSVD
jgi:hypothetical protein